MNFCEECGHSLSAGARFCESCGTALTVQDDPAGRSRAQSGVRDACLVVINQVGWLERWGAADTATLQRELASYLEIRSRQSEIDYTVFDISSTGLDAEPEWRQVVRAIERPARLRGVKFIFLIGGKDLPMAAYTNPHPENPQWDKNVHSDYGYGLLSENDLGLTDADGKEFPDYLVGRLPLGKDTSIQDVMRYFRNASDQRRWPGSGKKNFAGVSAEAWDRASEEVVRLLGVGKEFLHLSPAFSELQFTEVIKQNPVVLFFNVHGGKNPSQIGWSGHNKVTNEQGPQVASPETLKLENPNIIVTEACYGARFFDPTNILSDFTSDQSLLLKTIFHSALAFVGSSKITFAEGDVHGICYGASDKLTKEFLMPFVSSKEWSALSISLGEVMAYSRMSLITHEFDTFSNNPAIYLLRMKKMFLAFNLFGDPTLFSKPRNGILSKNGGATEESKAVPQTADLHGSLLSELQGMTSQVHNSMRRDLFRRVNRIHRSLSAEIKNGVNQSVYSRNPHLRGITPEEACYEGDWGGVGHLLMYRMDQDGFHRGAFAVCDGDGNFEKIFTYK